jgi:hypothetical protein
MLAGIAASYAIEGIPKEYLPFGISEMDRVLKPGGLLLLAFHMGRGSASREGVAGAAARSSPCNSTRGMYLPLLESQQPAVIVRVHDGKWILCTKGVVFIVMERAVSRRPKFSRPRGLRGLSPVSPFAT